MCAVVGAKKISKHFCGYDDFQIVVSFVKISSSQRENEDWFRTGGQGEGGLSRYHKT